MERASQVLADLTEYTSVILDVEPTSQQLTSFDIVQLSNHDAFGSFDTRSVQASHCPICDSGRTFLSRDLEVLRRLVDERFVGQTVLSIHYKPGRKYLKWYSDTLLQTDNVLDLMDYIFSNLFQETVFISGKVASLTMEILLPTTIG